MTNKKGKVVKLNPNKGAKATEDTKNVQTMPNPNEYGYREGTMVEIPFELLLEFIRQSQLVAMKETTVVYEPRDSFEQTIKTGKQNVTDVGLQAMRLTEQAIGVHMDNIDKGVAVHVSELQKEKAPTFEVEDVEKE